ncbi:MAG: tetratricopeptide repeat protein [Bryobacteraceae bacterium]
MAPQPAGGIGDEPPSPLVQAQYLIYDAWDTPHRAKRLSLARQALALSPDCADAYLQLAEDGAESPDEYLALCRQALAAAARGLGKERMREYRGIFWSVVETRPYMRARMALAEALWRTGKPEEAIEQYRAMLRLDRDDRLGVRYRLLSWLLLLRLDEEAGKLLRRFRGDALAAWRYSEVLLAFRRTGDTQEARNLLAGARKRNPHVPAYLLRQRPLPSAPPDSILLGDESEAIAYAQDFGEAWQDTSGALLWLNRYTSRRSRSAVEK